MGGHGGQGGRRGLLAAVLLLLLTDKVGDRTSDAAYQGPVLVKADAPVVTGIQVLDELVSSLSVPRVRQHMVELFLKHLPEAALADLVLD